MSNVKRNFRIFLISLIAFVIFFTFALVATLTNLYGDVSWARYIVYVFMLITLVSTIYFLVLYVTSKNTEHQLRQENLYNLGNKSTIFNIYLFEKKVDLYTKSFANRKKVNYIVAFTGGNSSVMSNANRNDEVSAFNAEVANYLMYDFAGNKTRFLKNKYLYCFDKGVFILFVSTPREDDIKPIVEKLNEQLFKIQERNEYHIWVQPFFGIAKFDKNESLFSCIDNAIYAREASENNFETYTTYDNSKRSVSSYDDTKEIMDALKNNEFVVYYQPKFSLKEKRFISSEALVRWNHPKLGLIGPALFIEKAERGGLIHSIDTFVFQKVCEDLNEAKRRGRRIMPVSVNFSLYEFFSNAFLNSILATIDQYDLPHNLIEIEITETTSQANQFLSISIIKRLRDQGIRVLMDDFGMGYSGINSLRRIPFDAVKIDKSFTDLIQEDVKTREIIKLLVELGHSSGIEVVIEGVDNKEQVDFLRKIKCDTIQGFYYSRPLSKEEYETFLKENPFEKGGKK